MDKALLNQTPIFNLSHVDFFGLTLKSDNPEWEKFIDDMLHIKYYAFRLSHHHNNIESMLYFLQLLEGKFIILKSDLILKLICKMKSSLEKQQLPELDKDYIMFVNVSRVIIYDVIQLLYNTNIKLNMENITKFLKMDSELDSEEKAMSDKLVKYDTIKKKVDTKRKLDIPTLMALFPSNDNSGCICF